ncbi:hypothetical protein ONZ45_g2026 [Pleurotus djamor]|nr:hypothetical protein ONZ45_g2026 [Pleurotus djamor]
MVTSFDPFDPDILRFPVCLASRTLQVCIIYKFERDRSGTDVLLNQLALGLVDPRIVVGLGFRSPIQSWPRIQRSPEEFLDDFMAIGSGPDFWEEAEGIIASRARRLEQ